MARPIPSSSRTVNRSIWRVPATKTDSSAATETIPPVGPVAPHAPRTTASTHTRPVTSAPDRLRPEGTPGPSGRSIHSDRTFDHDLTPDPTAPDPRCSGHRDFPHHLRHGHPIMTAATPFVKHYPDARRAAAARVHRDWLATLDCGVPLPALVSATPHHLEFEHLGDHLGDHQPGPDDLEMLARALGELHAAAHTKYLHTAQHDVPFPGPNGLVIADFLLTDTGVAIIDFDDLTLAPFGYDLAKLIVSTAMTYGRLDLRTVDHVLDIYNTLTATGGNTTCSAQQLRAYAEFHHLCTVRYLHRNGYRYAWPDVRPWRAVASR